MASGDQFWVPHPEEIWLPGKQIAPGGDEYETAKGCIKVPSGQKLEEISDEGVLTGVEDCCVLDQISQASILHTTRVRKQRGDIYTNISTVLLAVNPFRPLQIYSSEYLDLYHSSRNLGSLPPHIFGIGAHAFEGLNEMHESQAMLISGESGAGKTETMKLLLLYSSEVLSGQEGGLEDMVLELNPILESFGNAKTTRNDNSSRFGKWIEISVDPAKRTLCGATIIDYLLEVTRVCGQGPKERNYHIFYQLHADDATRSMLKLEKASEFEYLKANPMKIQSMDDEQEFKHLRQALVTLNFNGDEIQEIFKVVGGILHIGNFKFAENGEECIVTTDESLSIAAELLGVDSAALSKCTRFKRISTGKESMESPLDVEKANQARDSIAKLMYNRLFKWLVLRCNKALSEGVGSSGNVDGQLFFGILDIAGFETFETNKLEQLLINLSNEKLHQFFIGSVFKSELSEYQNEGINVSNIDFQDNADVLALIEAKDGILAILDDATNGVKQTDASFSENLSKQKQKHERFIAPKFKNDLAFGVKHYAGKVTYSTEGALVKNVSTQPPEVVELMGSSSLSVLKDIASDPNSSAQTKPGGGKSKATVCSGFKKSLDSLIEKLNQARCQFVRCIKPNHNRSPDQFDSAMVLNQLQLCGVMETVEIRKAGYLVRTNYLDFVKRYVISLPKAEREQINATAKGDGYKTACENMLKALESPESGTALGKTKVFVKADLHRSLEDRRLAVFERSGPKIQGAWRGHKTRKNMKEMLVVDRELKTCMAEAGRSLGSKTYVSKKIERATLAAGSLAAFDVVLLRAIQLPIKLTYLEEATKVRAHLAAVADLTRKMVKLQSCHDIPELQAAVAHAGNYYIVGPLVDALNLRIDTIKEQLPQCRALQGCVDKDSAADIKAVIESAKKLGLDQKDKWLVPDGPDAYEAAAAMLEMLEGKAREKEAFLAEQIKFLEEQMSSTDITNINEALSKAHENGIQHELMEKLEERCAKLQQQLNVIKSLEQAKEYTEPHLIEGILDKARGAGLDTPELWLFPEGATLFAEAEAQLEKAMKLKAQEMDDALELEALFEDMLKTSFDVPAMRNLIKRGVDKVKDSLITAMEQKCEKIVKQTPFRRALKNCDVYDDASDIQAVLDSVKEAGLDIVENWILPDGPIVYARACAQRERVDSLQAAKQRIARAAARCDASELEAAINTANELGVLQSEYAKAHRIFIKLQNAEEVKKMIDEISAGGTEEALANLQKQLQFLTQEDVEGAQAASATERLIQQLRSLETSCDAAAMEAAIARVEQAAICQATDTPEVDMLLANIKKRCARIQKQQACLKALEDCATSNDPNDIKSCLTDARFLGLDDPTKWLLQTGPVCFSVATHRLLEIEDVGRSAQKNIQELKGQLVEMLKSCDLPAMKVILERAARHGVIGEDVEALQNRVTTIQKQVPILKLLRNCTVYEDIEAIRLAHKKAVDAGLSFPEGWLILGGADAFAQVVKKLEQLEKKEAEAETMNEAEKMERQLKGLKESLDVPAMKNAITKAQTLGCRMEVIIMVKKRCEKLEAQLPLQRMLKNCEVYDQVEDVQAVLEKVQAAGLDVEERWLWPDGPKLYEKALKKPDYIREVNALQDRIKNAVRTFDMKELSVTFHKAEALGLPEYAYRNANKLYVELQNPTTVENKLKELREKGGTDPMDLLATSHLMDQLKTLGLKVDSKDMQNVASRMARGLRKSESAFESENSLQRTVAEKVFEDFANYSNLRDPLTWGTKGLWATVEDCGDTNMEARAKFMLQYTSERITEPLTKLEGNADLEQAALKNFWNLLRCLGDKPSAFVADKEGPIIKTAKRTALTDEVYIQVCKQLTGNPSIESCKNGWKLLGKLVKEVLPSDEFCEFLRAFLMKEVGQLKSDVDGDRARTPSNNHRRASRGADSENLSQDAQIKKAAWLNEKTTIADETLKQFLKKYKQEQRG